MAQQVKIGQKAPNFSVSEWAQGTPTNFDKELGNVVLLEVFQVNCPGCFLHALPEANRLHATYGNQGLKVIGLATAFEDYDKNNFTNLKLLADTNEVVGHTKQRLQQNGQLQKGNKLGYKIQFPLGQDVRTNNYSETFEKFQLQGTPSYILVDKKGILRDVNFGSSSKLENQIVALLKE